MKFHGGKQRIVINGNTYIDAADKKSRSLIRKIIRKELKGMLKKSAHDLASLLGENKKALSSFVVETGLAAAFKKTA